jgi:hypothetical protein
LTDSLTASETEEERDNQQLPEADASDHNPGESAEVVDGDASEPDGDDGDSALPATEREGEWFVVHTYAGYEN